MQYPAPQKIYIQGWVINILHNDYLTLSHLGCLSLYITVAAFGNTCLIWWSRWEELTKQGRVVTPDVSLYCIHMCKTCYKYCKLHLHFTICVVITQQMINKLCFSLTNALSQYMIMLCRLKAVLFVPLFESECSESAFGTAVAAQHGPV